MSDQPNYIPGQNHHLPGADADKVIAGLSESDQQDPRLSALVSEIRRLRLLVSGHAEIVQRHIEHSSILREEIESLKATRNSELSTLKK